MELRHWLTDVLSIALVLVIAYSQPIDDKADLYGPFCIERGCCNGREDNCALPIIGTLCYCDDFCMNLTTPERRHDDCCPDFWSVCKGLPTPTLPTIRPPTVRPPPEQIVEKCRYNGAFYLESESVMENCNKCVCQRVNFKLEMMCEGNICLVDERLINDINTRSTEYGWSAKNYSQFWGRTLDDGVVLRLGTLQPESTVLRMHPVRRLYDRFALPNEFDVEKEWPGYITGIQDQGWCGSSWAISTAAVASDRFAIHSRGMEQVQLSAQNLVSCDTQGQQSCHGGRLDRAWLFIKKHGLVDENCFPYRGDNVKCTIKRKGLLLDSGCSAPRTSPRIERYSVGPSYRLGKETDIMQEITASGPVQATMKVHHDFYQYSGGVYKRTGLASSDKQGYHSVRIVGWGEVFTRSGVQKYWKVANSWGPNWGENGFFRIARGTNECDIESFVLASWPTIEEKIKAKIRNQI